jgi:hypothetical protein
MTKMIDKEMSCAMTQISDLSCVWYIEHIRNHYGDEKLLIGVFPGCANDDTDKIKSLIPIGCPYKIEYANTLRIIVDND